MWMVLHDIEDVQERLLFHLSALDKFLFYYDLLLHYAKELK